MSWWEIDGDHLRVRFTRAEQVLGLVRDQSVPLSSIVSVQLVGSWREAGECGSAWTCSACAGSAPGIVGDTDSSCRCNAGSPRRGSRQV